MSRLPVIVGFGGYSAAGRSSFHHGYRRMVIESLDDHTRRETLSGLAVMMNLIEADADGFRSKNGDSLTLEAIESQFGEQVLEGTLIRRIEKTHFDVDAAPWQQALDVDEEGTSFLLSRKKVPSPVPESWSLSDYSSTQVRVTLADNDKIKVDSVRDMAVKSAGQLPTGFEPGELYNSRFHPRGLQMTVVGMSDALHSMGIPWSQIQAAVRPDQVAVFAGSLFGQTDEYGLGGMMKSRLQGGRVSAKQLALGLNTMPADFINAYVLGSVGTTACATGACATFLYNLKMGVEEIQSEKARVVIVGNSEAAVTQEIIDGFGAMGALGTEEGLKKIEGTDTPDLRRSSRPFGDNCGFTIAESSQFIILMDDELAVELGAQIHGAVTDVFINADGFKKSISAPGPGNYITLAKAVASAREMLGDEVVRKHSMIHAHGSSTPANRTTESDLFDRVATAFDIDAWPVAAVKAYVGHSLAPASGDQIVSALGSFKYGLVPGIKTIDGVADDVHQDRLRISTVDFEVPQLQVAFINSKGFGGNNASAVVIAPSVVKKMLKRRYGEEKMNAYELRCESVQESAENYNQAAMRGDFNIIYNFGEGLIDDKEMEISDSSITVPGLDQAIEYGNINRYGDMF